MEEAVLDLLMEQVEEVRAKYPNLQLLLCPPSDFKVQGRIDFVVPWEDKEIEDSYEVELCIPQSYPLLPPECYETAEKIPKSFGHFLKNGSLCLGAPVEVQIQFSRHRNLLKFIDGQLIPYLFAYSYKREFGEVPFGERMHNYLGLLEFYRDYFNVDFRSALKLLKCLADNFAPPASRCRCGSGEQLQNCHGPKLEELRRHHYPRGFEIELSHIIKDLESARIDFPKMSVLPKRALRKLKRRFK